MGQGFNAQRRWRGVEHGGIAWLIAAATGDLADALDRDLRCDRLDFDELGWRGLWNYVAKAPPGTAIYHHVTNGVSPGDDVLIVMANVLRELNWRYTARNFVDGNKIQFPTLLPFLNDLDENGDLVVEEQQPKTLDELVSPEVRELLRGA